MLALASLVLVAGIVGAAVGVGDDDNDAPLAVATTAPAASLTPAPPSAAASPTASAAPQATATPAPTSAPTGGLSQAVPPKPGSYRYRETSGGETSEQTLRITDKGAGRQTEEDGEVTSEVAWRDDGKYIVETTFTAQQGGFRCDWDPDVLEYKFPLASGATWRIKNTCTVAQGFSIEIDSTSRVTGSEKTSAAGQTVDTWIVHSEGTLTFRTPQGSSKQNLTADDRFSPAHGLSVHVSETIRGPDPATGENVNESSTRELLNLTPASGSA